MKLWTIRVIIVLLLLIQVPVLPALASAFPDVQGTGYERAYTSLAAENIITQGRPYETLNRAEALKIAVMANSQMAQSAQQYSTHGIQEQLFKDVGTNDWFTPYVHAAFAKGVVTGYGDGTFRPGRLLSTEEAVTILLRSAGERGSGGAAMGSPYIQNADSQWYTMYINAAIRRNLIENRGRMLLGAAISRGQFIEMAYRLHVINRSGDARYAETADSSAAPVIVSAAPAAQRPAVSIHAPQPQTLATPLQQRPQYASERYFAVTVPSVGITDLPVSRPVDPFSKEGILAPLKHGVGHLFSYPGSGGKVMIYGHSSAYPWDVSSYTKIFRTINNLRAGDRIYVTYDGTFYVYEVTFGEAILASDTSRFQDNGQGEELILYTCWPPDSITQRYLVHAIPVQTIALQ
ncbi:sortase [Candidatus Peribacteria bacterium]|nr:sortase [Candidatus Peribacteria bacterium]